MKQMLKIEIQRAFSGAAFKVSLIIGCLISILQRQLSDCRAASAVKLMTPSWFLKNMFRTNSVVRQTSTILES